MPDLSVPDAQLVGALPAPEDGHDVVHGGLGDVVQRLLGQEGLVGGDDHIGHGDQPGQPLVVEDVAGAILENLGKGGNTDA